MSALDSLASVRVLGVVVVARYFTGGSVVCSVYAGYGAAGGDYLC